MVYKYGGKLTISEADRYEQELKTAKADLRAAHEHGRQETKRADIAEVMLAKLVAENMVLKEDRNRLRKLDLTARRKIGNLEAALKAAPLKYADTLRELRRDKKRLQSRIIDLKKTRPTKRTKPLLAPVADIIQLSGPEGLAAAVAEARRYNKARNAA